MRCARAAFRVHACASDCRLAFVLPKLNNGFAAALETLDFFVCVFEQIYTFFNNTILPFFLLLNKKSKNGR